MTSVPVEHIHDSQKLVADASIDLFELTPAGTTATLFFKADNTLEFLGETYEGMPLQFVGLSRATDGSSIMPKLTIGDGQQSLEAFKPLVFDGNLDGATLVHHEVLLDNLLANADIKQTMVYRVKRIPSYTAIFIELQLATASDAMGYTIPSRAFFPPAFPAVAQ